jgi:8-amino-7-oxononanoate synthase
MPQKRTVTYPSLFDKAEKFFDPEGLFQQVKDANLYPYFRPIEKNDGARALMNGREIVMAGSNNYLGLASDPRVKEAAKAAIDKYGTGCTGSRFLNGTLDSHIELEHKLAEFMGKEACVLFSTGYIITLVLLQGNKLPLQR